MTTTTEVPWYVTKRGELLAKQFLFELDPNDLVYTGDHPEHFFDYMILYLKSDGSPVTIAMTVKPTEEEIKGVYPVKVSELNRLKNANIPVLMLVIDVKQNHYFFNWVQEVTQSEELAIANSDELDQSILIPLRHGTTEEIQKLKQEILAIN
ncbi:hypothetical protein H6G45_08020 [Synechocystis sp. FACHB-383]|uniref:hypothetical protein n=1 Tax=Synechocystis sp. FACHB-383 TaxID=2692864 RepID=UPI0016855AB2|nr:hypothetical protein [Synechocystis sp. FACHB-383]MBD2653437.1 hypothetical protein [Synechocystis sp. FACHB-383]